MCEGCAPRLSRRDALALAGGTIAAASLLTALPVSVQAEPSDVGISIQPRSVWAGDTRPPVGELGTEDVRFLLVHHTASVNGADPIGTMRGVYNFHTSEEKGWPDVAYNFFIDQNGIVYEARTGSLAGPVEASATGGNQGFAQLVCLLGDFTSQNPTDAALASLNSTLAWLADRYGLDTSPGARTTFTSRGSNRWSAGTPVTASTVSGHRDMSRTACPGDTFYPYLVANVQREVHTLRAATGAVPTTTPRAPESSTTAPSSEATTTAAEPPATASPTTTENTATTTAPATVADGSVAVLPPPASEAPAADVSSSDDGWSPSTGTAGALAAGATVLVGAGVVAIGMRRRQGDETSPDGERPPGDFPVDRPHGGRDPLP